MDKCPRPIHTPNALLSTSYVNLVGFALDGPCVVVKVAVAVRDLVVRLLQVTQVFVVQRLAQPVLHPTTMRVNVQGRRKVTWVLYVPARSL